MSKVSAWASKACWRGIPRMSDHRGMRILFREIPSGQGIFGSFMRMQLCNDVRNCLYISFKEEWMEWDIWEEKWKGDKEGGMKGAIYPPLLMFMARGVGNNCYLKRGVICWGLDYCPVWFMWHDLCGMMRQLVVIAWHCEWGCKVSFS